MRKWNNEFQCDGKISVKSLSVILTSNFQKKNGANLSVIYGTCQQSRGSTYRNPVARNASRA